MSICTCKSDCCANCNLVQFGLFLEESPCVEGLSQLSSSVMHVKSWWLEFDSYLTCVTRATAQRQRLFIKRHVPTIGGKTACANQCLKPAKLVKTDSDLASAAAFYLINHVCQIMWQWVVNSKSVIELRGPLTDLQERLKQSEQKQARTSLCHFDIKQFTHDSLVLPWLMGILILQGSSHCVSEAKLSFNVALTRSGDVHVLCGSCVQANANVDAISKHLAIALSNAHCQTWTAFGICGWMIS